MSSRFPTPAHSGPLAGNLLWQAAIEDVSERATAEEVLPQNFGVPGAGARLRRSHVSNHQELRFRHDRIEAVACWHDSPAF